MEGPILWKLSITMLLCHMLNDDHENTQYQETNMCTLNQLHEMSVISLTVVKWMQRKCMIIKEASKSHGLFLY